MSQIVIAGGTGFSPLSVALPWALASAEGPQGSRFPAVRVGYILGDCALVLIANLAGMHLGGGGPPRGSATAPRRSEPDQWHGNQA